jgi:hypothetical protein
LSLTQVEQNFVRLSYNPDIFVLSVTMPTIFHNCHISWAVREFVRDSAAGFFTPNEIDDLDLSSNSRKPLFFLSKIPFMQHVNQSQQDSTTSRSRGRISIKSQI